jgi:hypothetical protein
LNATSASYAVSASNATNAVTASFANAFTVANTLTATTLVVQTVSSSVIYSSGSNVFGNNIANTQTFTGSVLVTGSITANKVILSGGADQSELTNATNNDFKLTNSGNFRVVNNANTVALLTVQNTGSVGIGTSSPNTWATNLVVYNNQLTITGGGYDASFADSIFFGGNSEGTTYRNKISNSLSSNPANQKMRFSVASGSTTFSDVMTLVGNGGVGIGTSSPSFPLHIYSPPGTFNALLQMQGTTNYSGFYAKNTGGELYLAIDNSTGTGFGNGGYSRLIYSNGSYPLDFYTNDLIRMRITSGGLVTMPYQPSFYATSTAGETAYTANQVIVFNTTRHNTGSHYNTSTGRFTAPVAGKYLFTFNCYAYGGYITGVVLTINGSQYTVTDVQPYANTSAANYSITIGFALVWELAAGDYVEPRSRGASQIYRAHSHFSGQLLS